MILDGEIVAYDRQGIPNFQLLQHYAEKRKAPITYQVFDLLFLNGHSTRELPLIKRKELLKETLLETPHVKYCDHVNGAGREFFKVIQGEKIEGIMAKKKSSIYIEGHALRNGSKLRIIQQTKPLLPDTPSPGVA